MYVFGFLFWYLPVYKFWRSLHVISLKKCDNLLFSLINFELLHQTFCYNYTMSAPLYKPCFLSNSLLILLDLTVFQPIIRASSLFIFSFTIIVQIFISFTIIFQMFISLAQPFAKVYPQGYTYHQLGTADIDYKRHTLGLLTEQNISDFV